jgi:ferric-dicitrate binding protein FerR (iron transport regulator)
VGANGCDAARPLLAGLVYDDLSAGEKERAQAHVAACAECRAALASMRQASAALNAWVLPPARRAAAERPTRRRYVSRKVARLPLLGWAAAAAVFLLAVTLHLATRPRAVPPGPAVAAPAPVPPPLPPPVETADLEKARREAEDEIARLEEVARRARERRQEIERAVEKLVAERKDVDEEARLAAERKKVDEEIYRTRENRRAAEVKLVRAQTPGTVAVVGQLEWVQGEVYVLTPAGKVRATPSKALVSGNGLETLGTDSLAIVTFPDATRLEVGTGTTVRGLADGEKGKQIDLVRGTLKADVARQPADRPLVVRTPDAEARVLGTRLRVVSQDATRLEVQEGRVRLHRAKDGAAVELSAGTYAVTNVPRMIPKPIREVAFQDGAGPVPTYAGTRDTFLSELNSAHPYGTNSKIQVDGDNPGGSGKELRGLVRWDVSPIPPGSKAHAAALVFRATSPSEPPYALHAMKRAWSETEATWQTSSGDKAAPVLGYAIPSGPDEFVFPLNAEGVALVQSWIDSPASNHGLMITAPGNSSGLQVHSRESSEASKRPKLIVTFTPRENR